MSFSIEYNLLVTFCLVLCRISTVLVALPLFSSSNIPKISKIHIIVAISILLTFNIKVVIPNDLNYGIMIISEVITGLTLSIFMRIIMSLIHIIGTIIASQVGLNNGNIFDHAFNYDNTMIGNLISLITTVLIAELGLHIEIIKIIQYNYNNFPIGEILKYDITQVILQLFGQVWYLAIQISMPFIIINLLLNMGAGLLAKLMPQLQIFFMVLPIQLLLGFIILFLTLFSIAFNIIQFYQINTINIFTNLK
jgi:flagellar biosynthetic protein FliR